MLIASQLGYPVALKVVGPDLSHKSDVGGVRLALGSEAAVGGEHALGAEEIPAAVGRQGTRAIQGEQFRRLPAREVPRRNGDTILALQSKLLQRRTQVVVQVHRIAPPLSRAQERGDHVGLHRTGPEQRDVDDQVLPPGGLELLEQLPLAGGRP